MDQITLIFLIALGIVIILGGLFFFFAGLFKVKKDQVMIIERMNEFKGVYEKGIYWFMPIVYRRVGVYTMKEMEQTIHFDDLRDMVIRFQVGDVIKYHYSEYNVEQKVNEAHKKYPEMSEEILKSELLDIGIRFISIRAK